MKIAIGTDHAGFDLKQEIGLRLRDAGHDVQDFGTHCATPVDYPDFAHPVARAVSLGDVERGILICGSGVGVAIAANRHRGVRAAVVADVETARLTRAHNDLNVLCLAARRVDRTLVPAIVEAFLREPFEGGRHLDRVRKIELA